MIRLSLLNIKTQLQLVILALRYIEYNNLRLSLRYYRIIIPSELISS